MLNVNLKLPLIIFAAVIYNPVAPTLPVNPMFPVNPVGPVAPNTEPNAINVFPSLNNSCKFPDITAAEFMYIPDAPTLPVNPVAPVAPIFP